MAKKRYKTDLTDAEWHVLEPLLPGPYGRGRPRKYSQREMLNAVFYVLRTGCAWRHLPHDLPPWSSVYNRFRRWRIQGVWERVHAALREQVRVRSGRDPTPSAAVIDSQSVKTTDVGGPRGFDGHKKVNGRKRHVLVDTTGLLLKVVVHPASVQDREGGKLLVEAAAGQFPRLERIWADQGYTGAFPKLVREKLGATLEVVYPWWRQMKRYAPDLLEREPEPGFNVLPRRWVVERTFAWIGRYRRLARDYERRPTQSEAMVYAAMARLMLARLAARA